MSEVSFFIAGHARTQGSLSFYGKGHGFGHHSKELLDWRRYVAMAAQQHWHGGVSIADFEVGFVFLLPDRRARDIDKLERAMLDALTGVVWRDDKQVARHCTPFGKRVVRDGEEPGVWVLLRSLPLGWDENWP